MDEPTSNRGKRGLFFEIIRNGRLTLSLLRDKRVSTATKLFIPGLAALYLLFPADLLPDVIPVLGQMDDLAVIGLAIKFFIDMCPPGVVAQLREALDGEAGTHKRPPADRREGEIVDGEYRVID